MTADPQQNAPITSQNAPELTLNMGDPAPSAGATAGVDLEAIREHLEDADRDVETLQAVVKRQDAEVAQLRADLAHAQAERDREHDKYIGILTLESGTALERDQLRAQVEAMRPVVKAAQGVINCALAYTRDLVSVHANGPGACLELLRDAVAALDHALQQQQEVPD